MIRFEQGISEHQGKDSEGWVLTITVGRFVFDFWFTRVKR